MAYNPKWGEILNRRELSRFIGITGASLGQVEKDYFQHIVLSSISRKFAGELIFKGGTALQKMGYVERFSEDLDFTTSGQIDIETLMRNSLEAISIYNFDASCDRLRDGKNSTGFRLRIEGPLYRGAIGLCTINLDISTREKVVLAPEIREYSPVYPDVASYILKTMKLDEILSEKIRAIMTRRRPRDLYDASMLLERGVHINRELVEAKLEYSGMSFDEETLLKRSSELKKMWNAELKQLLKSPPDHEKCLGSLARALEKMKMK
ncbi:MAG: hypothetical protein DRN57_01370 [Thermoplasmata archaeon]|nr:MAG: hypothetical protein DRN57_01370 [Thermoplasmata archaeon]